jgi:ligand-binding sensor domain-containing protein
LAEPIDEGLDLEITSLLRGDDGSLWFGLAGDGILRWDGENWSPEDGVGKGGPDGGERGLLHYRPETDAWEAVADSEQLLVNTVAWLDDGALWAGSEDGRVARSDNYGANSTVVGTAGDGIGDNITAIVGDEAGRVWVGIYGGGVSVLEDGVWRNLQQ